ISQMRKDRLAVPWKHAKGDVIDVAAFLTRCRSAGTAQLAVDRHQIDQRGSNAQLIKSDRFLLPFPPRAEHVDVEIGDLLEIGHAEDDVIDGRNVDHWRSSAATPASVRPSIHSRNAPPAVD